MQWEEGVGPVERGGQWLSGSVARSPTLFLVPDVAMFAYVGSGLQTRVWGEMRHVGEDGASGGSRVLARDQSMPVVMSTSNKRTPARGHPASASATHGLEPTDLSRGFVIKTDEI